MYLSFSILHIPVSIHEGSTPPLPKRALKIISLFSTDNFARETDCAFLSFSVMHVVVCFLGDVIHQIPILQMFTTTIWLMSDFSFESMQNIKITFGHKYHVQLIQDIDPNDPSKMKLCIYLDGIPECDEIKDVMNYKDVQLMMLRRSMDNSEMSNFKAEVLI